MENQEQELVYDRLTGLEKRIGNVDRKVDDLEDKVDVVKDRNDERHIEMVRLTTELKGFSKATEQNTERMATSIEGLVDELKQSNASTEERFKEVNTDIRDVRTKIEGQESDKTIKLEEKKLSNKVILAIIGGGLVLLEVCVQVIGPAFFS